MNNLIINSVEALLFGSGRPIRLSEIRNILEISRYLLGISRHFLKSISFLEISSSFPKVFLEILEIYYKVVCYKKKWK